MYSFLMSIILDIGSSLSVARRAAGLSQRELAQRLGTSQQQIARWEATGYRTAVLGRVADAVAALGVDAEASVVAEARAQYASRPATGTAPARDLGDIAARIRARGAWLSDEYGVASVAVFGSFATGEQSPASDVDLLIEIADRDKVRGFRFVELARIFEKMLGRSVDVAQPHLVRERLKQRVMEEAVVVWAA
jgi:uncharacterized protein